MEELQASVLATVQPNRRHEVSCGLARYGPELSPRDAREPGRFRGELTAVSQLDLTFYAIGHSYSSNTHSQFYGCDVTPNTLRVQCGGQRG